MKDIDEYFTAALQVESFTLNILERGTVVKEIVEVDVDNYYLTSSPPSIPSFFVPTLNSVFNTSDSYFKSVQA